MKREFNLTDDCRLIRARELQKLLQVSRVSLWRWGRDGSFPLPINLSNRSIAWKMSEIEDWVNSKTKEII